MDKGTVLTDDKIEDRTVAWSNSGVAAFEHKVRFIEMRNKSNRYPVTYAIE